MFGGVPISVAIPPMFAAQAMLKRSCLSILLEASEGKTAKTLVAMGNIMIEVAVLLIHMDIKPVLSIKPANSPELLVPVRRNIQSAIL